MQGSSERLTLVLQALRRVLAPAVRLALWAGAKHQHLDELMRLVFIDEARKQLEANGIKANASHISVVTGIHRKDLRLRMQAPADQLPDTQRSQTARMVARWLRIAQMDPGLARLPLMAPPEQWSVDKLVRSETGGDTHYKAALSELERLEFVQLDGDFATVNTSGFGTSQELAQALSFLADNTRDHLAAAAANVTGESPKFVERALYTENLTPESVNAIQAHVQERWAQLYAEAFEKLLAAEEPLNPRATQRIRLGLYVFAEPMPEPSAHIGAPEPDGRSTPRSNP